MATKRQATVDDLHGVEGKAELVNGELVLMPLSGGLHGWIAGNVFASLLAYGKRTGHGRALPDSVGFLVNLPNRRSFAPDASFCTQTLTEQFVDGAPVFAVEVRNPDDYGLKAEQALAAKRADYFAAGTGVVWDVDAKAQIVRSYRAADPNVPLIFGPGENAHAEPPLPGWSMSVDDLFSE